jgi:Dual specificity phosphatase, catalytic domain
LAERRYAVERHAAKPSYDRLVSTYWVEPGRLLAGSYPDSLDYLVEAGVTLVVDLTEEGERPAYDSPVPRVRVPVADFSCPTPETMNEILDVIDAELAAGGVVYVHCYGGVGRTGTVVGCWLTRHGASLARLPRPPETDEQRRLLASWKSLDRGMRTPPGRS